MAGSNTDADQFLAALLERDLELKHYGVKGMRWGKRKAATPGTPDAERAKELKTRAVKEGTKSLSNRELQDLVTRMNLEQQYSRLNPKTKSDGQKFLEIALKAGAPLAVDAFSSQLGPYAGATKALVNAAVNTSTKKK